MKKIIFVVLILPSQYSYSQTAQTSYEKCIQSINERETKANDDLLNKWYEDNPNPQKYVYLACDDHCPRYYCRRHHKQCISYCDCYKQYESEEKSITERYEAMRNACENTYKRAVAEENAKAERERKADEEQRQKEENERLEKERKQKEKSNLENDKKSSGSSKNESTSIDPKVFEMQARYSEQRRKDSIENAQMGAVAVTAAAAMFAMGDKELNRKEEDYQVGTYLKAVLGLGFNFLPVIENDNYNGTYMSISTTSDFPMIEGSLQFAAFNSSFISWKLGPYGYFGMNALDPGATGTHFCYGGGTSLGIGKRFKLLLQGEYLFRSGSVSIDDAVNFADTKGTANYSYSTLKYGPGIQLRIGDADSWGGSTEYSLSVFREKLSFLKGENNNKNVFSFQFKMSAKICSLLAEYSSDYPVAGDILFPATYDKEKQYLMRFGISVPLTILSN